MVDIELVETPPVTVATIRRVVPMEELPAFFGEAFTAVAAAVPAAGGAIAGPPFGWYHGRPTDSLEVSAGFPLAGPVGLPDGAVRLQERPGGQAAVGIHAGPYDTMGRTYAELEAWLSERGHVAGDMWEEYLTPPEGDPLSWRTRIVALIG